MSIRGWLAYVRLAWEETRHVAARALHSTPSGSTPNTVQLEDRILLSATPAPVMVEGEMDASDGDLVSTEADGSQAAETHQAQNEDVRSADDALHLLDTVIDDVMLAGEDATTQLLEIDSVLVNSTFDGQIDGKTNSGDLSAAADYTASPARELVFVDEGVEGFRQLVTDLAADRTDGRQIDVVVLAADRDGLEQITETLSQYNDLDAIHLVSHGTDGAVKLGSTWLTMNNLEAYTSQLVAWQDALAGDADLLIYGCDLAGSEQGQTLVEAIGTLCDCDVSASDDPTGHAELGGDWELEYRSGTIDTGVVFTAFVQQNWEHTLDVATFEQGADSYGGAQDTYISSSFPTTAYEDSTELIVNGGSAHYQALIRFDDIFGSGPNQIPLGSVINSASLEVYVHQTTNNGTVSLHSMLIDWNDTDSWNVLGTGVQIDGNEANSAADSALDSELSGWQTFGGLESTLQMWSDGTANYGWVMELDRNGEWRANSSEGSFKPRLTVNFTPANAAPTLTSFAAAVDTTDEDTEVEITFADLASQGNEADSDGTVDAFAVQSVSSGSLKIGSSAGTATVWAAGVNDTIDAANHAYWTPATDVSGTLGAFAVVAQDNLGAESTGDVAVQVSVTAQNDAPIANSDPGSYASTLLSQNPISYWRLGESSGTSAADDGSLDNGGVYHGTTLAQTGAVQGDSDTPVRFDGSSDYVEIAHSGSYLLDEGTLQLWFNADDPSGGDLQHLFSKDSSGNGSGGHLSMYLTTSGHLEVRLQSASADYIVTSTSTVSSGTWHHAAFSFGSNGMSLYLDGQLVDSDGYTGGLGTTSGGVGNLEPMAIGAGTQNSGDTVLTPLNQFFTGLIDEVAILGSSLDVNAIEDLYAAGSAQYATVHDSTLTVTAVDGVLENDTDVEGDGLTASLVSGPTHAESFTLNSDGSFSYTPVAGFSGTDVFTYKANDGLADSNETTVTLTVTNSAPVVSLPGGMASFTENTGAVLIDAYATVNDSDSANIETGTLTVEFTGAATANDRLAIRDQGGGAGNVSVSGSDVLFDFGSGPTVIGAFTGGTDGSTPLVVTFNGNATPAAAQALLRNITFENVSPDPDTTQRTLRVVITDGDGGTSNAATKMINVTAAPWMITGRVYEDVDGDGDIADDGAGAGSALLHLYRDGGDGTPDGVDDLFVTTKATDLAGEYTFGDRADGTYWVVVDSTSIAPAAGFNIGFDIGDVWAEQTYGSTDAVTYDGIYSYLSADGTLYGGKQGEVSDDASSMLSAEHITRVTVAGADTSGIDYGFSFNTIAQTGDGDDHPANDRSMQGSLRQFIQNSNALLGTQSSQFAISTDDSGYDGTGNGEYTIQLASGLPDITDTVVLDGSTQTGFVDRPIIELNGAAAGGGSDGLALADGSDNSIVRSLVINRFLGDGVHVKAGADGITLAGNYIGTDVTGTIDVGNSDYGVRIDAGTDGTIIGGTAVGAGNVISGNSDDGIRIYSSANHVIQGNLIGVTATGDARLGNSSEGITLSGTTDVQIGGTAAGAGNVIGDSGQEGIWIVNGTSGTVIQGNYIGTDVTGTVDLGNNDSGIGIGNTAAASSNNLVGGTTPGAGNIIAFNDRIGVAIDQSTSGASIGNAVLGNAIYANSGLGIDLDDAYAVPPSNGVTVNDAGDGDTGGNNRQNFPVLETVTTNEVNAVTINGYLASTASTDFRLEFFASSAEDSSGHGEAERFIGYVNVTTNVGGSAGFNATLTASVASGEFITATATVISGGSYGDTSEYAENVTANLPPVIGGMGPALNYTENDPATLIVPVATLTDTDSANFEGGMLRVLIAANATADDRLSVRHQGSGLGEIGISGSNVTYEGTVVGTVIGGTDGFTPLEINFNSSSTVVAAQALLQNITYENISDDPSTAARTVRFVIADGDGGMSNSVAQTISVNAINNAPVLGNNSLLITEGGTVTLTGSELSASDADGDALTYDLTNVGGGQFELSSNPGVEVTSFTQVQLDAGQVVFVHDGGEAAPSYDITVTDGTLSDGPESAAITFMNVNDAPVLTDANDLTLIDEDIVGDAGTLVSNLVSGQVTDADAGALSGMAVIEVDNTHGTWEYTTDGSNWTAFGAVDASAARLLAADANTSVRFVPDADWNGTVTDGITFHAWDQTSGTAGGTADLTERIRDEFTTVSYSNNDGNATWATDWIENDTSGGDFSSGNISVSGQQLLLFPRNTGDSIYRQVDLTGASSATLSFDYSNGLAGAKRVQLQISDNGGASFTTLTTFTDVMNSGIGAFSTDISGYIAGDTQIRFYFSGSSNGANVLSVDNVQIQYTSADKTGGTHAYSTATAGCDITVNPVNDAPILSGANDLTSILEDDISSSGTLVSDLLSGHVADEDVSDLSGVAVIAVNDSHGSWEYTVDGGSNWLSLGSPSDTAARLLAADALTRVRFVPDSNHNGTVASGVTFRAWDQTSGSNGQVLNISGVDSGSDGFNTVFYSNNDGTTNWTGDWIESDNNGGGASGGFFSVDSGMLRLAAGDGGDNIYREIDTSGATTATLTFNYENVLSGEDEIRVQVSGNGGSSYTDVYTFSGTANTGSDSASIDISSYIAPNTRIRFYVFKNDSGDNLYIDNVAVTFDNGDGAPGGETAYSADSASSSVSVTPVNDAPNVGTNGGATVAEGGGVTLGRGDLAAADPDDSGTGLVYTVTGDPANGQLELSTNPGVAISSFTQDDLDYNRVIYVHDGSQTSSDSFDFSLADGGEDGAAAASGTFNLTVTNTNGAPVLGNNSLTISEGGTVTLSASELSASDLDGDALSYSVSNVTGGQFELSTSPGVSITGFTQLQLTGGQVVFVHDGNEAAPSYDITVTDGTLSDGPESAAITFSNVNDAPTELALSDSNVDEHSSNETLVGIASVTDPDIGDTANYSLVDDAGGRFAVDSVTGALTVRDGSLLDYESASSYDITIEVVDGAGVSISEVFAISVSDINETPIATGESFTTTQMDSLVITAPGLLANDVDVDANAMSIVLVTGVTHGSLIVNGDGSFTYVPGAAFYGTDSFTYVVTDGQTSSTPVSVSIRVDGSPVIVEDSPPSEFESAEEVEEAEEAVQTEDTMEETAEQAESGESGEATTEATASEGASAATVSPLTLGGYANRIGENTPPSWSTSSQSQENVVEQRNSAAENASGYGMVARARRGSHFRSIVDAIQSTATKPFVSELVDVFASSPLSVLGASQDWAAAVRGESSVEFDEVVLGTTAFVSTGLSVGYIIWLLRGGTLCASVIASMPAWTMVDPMPILNSFADSDESEEEEESLCDLVT